MSILLRVREAAAEGLLWGLELTLALLLPGLLIASLAGDYRAVRAQAQQGAAAFEYLQKAVAEQQKAQAAARPPVPADPAK